MNDANSLVHTWFDSDNNEYICGVYRYGHNKLSLLIDLIGVFDEPGLYIFVRHDSTLAGLLYLPEVLYIGESENLRSRLLSHNEHNALVASEVTHVHVWTGDLNKSERMRREISLKKRNPPKLNPL